MVKPSVKSFEGWTHAGLLSACVWFISIILGGNGSSLPPLDEVLKHAGSANEIAQAYLNDSRNISEAFDLGKLGIIMAFAYKVFTRFLDGRNKLKEKELEK